MRGLLPAALLLVAAGCGAAPHSRAAGGIATLAAHPVAWNPANAPIGTVRAVADAGDVIAVFDDASATVFSSGAVVARDTHVKGWTSAAALFATDGVTPWIVGVDGAGHVQRLRAQSVFEDVSARYQLSGKRVRAATIVGASRDGFLLDDGVALSEASKMSVFPSAHFTSLVGGGGFVAGVTSSGIDLLNATNGFVTHFTLPGLSWVALDTRGHLYAATKRAVYSADASGALNLVFDAGDDGIHGLVASGDRIWFADRDQLGVVENGRVTETDGLHLASDATLQRSSSGDVWVIGSGKLARYATASSSLASTQRARDSSWRQVIAPVFARACASCHQPDGVAGVDLSSETMWRAKRSLIRERVLVSHTMPPQGHALSEDDRAAIHTWIEGVP